MLASLRRKYPDAGSVGYIYNSIDLPQRALGPRTGLARLLRVTQRVVRRLSSSRLILFNDRIAGRKGVSRRRRDEPIQVAPHETLRILTKHMFFRHPTRRADNYYVTDATLGWFIVLCHEDDWHLLAPRGLLRTVSLA